jgi:multidrug resistance efflux pump
LASNHAASDEQMVQKRQAFEAVKAQVAHAQAELDLVKAGAWEPTKALARAQLAEAEARLAQTEIELERLTVRAPIDGHILQVNVRVGEYVNCTQEKSALIVMGDLDCLHLRADLDEADVPRFDATAQARAYLRGCPDKPFMLTFVRVEPALIPKRSLTGQTTERVDTRVLQVIYRIEPTDQPLYVGQQMDAFVEVPRLR